MQSSKDLPTSPVGWLGEYWLRRATVEARDPDDLAALTKQAEQQARELRCAVNHSSRMYATGTACRDVHFPGVLAASNQRVAQLSEASAVLRAARYAAAHPALVLPSHGVLSIVVDTQLVDTQHARLVAAVLDRAECYTAKPYVPATERQMAGGDDRVARWAVASRLAHTSPTLIRAYSNERELERGYQLFRVSPHVHPVHRFACEAQADVHLMADYTTWSVHVRGCSWVALSLERTPSHDEARCMVCARGSKCATAGCRASHTKEAAEAAEAARAALKAATSRGGFCL